MPYVCNCTGIGSQAFCDHLEAGAKTPAQVYKAHGTKPDCGRCAVGMRQLIEEWQRTGSREAVLERLKQGIDFAPAPCSAGLAAVSWTVPTPEELQRRRAAAKSGPRPG